jgi:hypothetical protein
MKGVRISCWHRRHEGDERNHRPGKGERSEGERPAKGDVEQRKAEQAKVEVERPNAERPKAEVEKPKEQQRKGRMTCAN